MAEWNKGKVLPSAINGGQEFTKKDNLAVNELNAIVNNSFYASEKSERAERLAESAVEGNGTLVTIGGQIQGEWSADFAESERQKSETNGAIVHEEDIADVEHIETIYDMKTKNIINGTAYTSGIVPNTTISDIDLSKYKFLRIWFANYGHLQYQGFLTLNIEGNGYREIQSTIWDLNYQIAVNKLDDTSSLTNNSGANCNIGRIEGVY